MIASSEELSLLFAIPQEPPVTVAGRAPADGAVRLDGVVTEGARFDFALAAGEQLVTMTDGGAERMLSMVLKRHVVPERGLVTVGGADIASFDMYLLRSEVMVLDRPSIVEVKIREYLSLALEDAGSGVSSSAMLEALEAVGLRDRVARLPQGLDTVLAASGYPLSIGELMALKLANALLVRPHVLMLSQLYDLLPAERLVSVLARLREAGTTVLLSTGRPEDIALDGWFYLEPHRQRRFETREALIAAQQQGAGNAVQG